MSKGRGGRMLGSAGSAATCPGSRLRGSGGGPGAPTGGNDPQAQKRELLCTLRESRR
ncbi:hypothetical protein [Streptomyces sp. NPDC006925]|uniref:hypothetical protein n=1 Tax=Streptomyces sp. NPDC006925 TaxID=3364768 RepID=UPI00368CBF99